MAVTIISSCKSGEDSSTKVQSKIAKQVEKDGVKVLYFHATRRCATCEAIEKVASETVKNQYADKVTFISINREEELQLAKTFQISGQSLLVIKDKEVFNLTNEAFMYARTSPEKLEAKVIETLGRLVN